MIQNGQSSQNNNAEHGISEVINTPKSTEEKLLVAVRVRPLKPDEGPRIIHVIDDKTLVLSNDGSKREGPRRHRVTDRHYVYHRVFAEDSTQEEVYSVVCAPLVSGALAGYAGAVFAYGATGAGKTHTMRSLMKQALAHIFDDDAAKGATQDDDFQVMMSYLEIYNENIRDLLNPSPSALELREEGVGALAVAGLTEVRARSPAEAARLLERGERARTAEPTEANQASSRGHALLSITVCRSSTATTGSEPSGASRGRLFLVDLAGSERAGRGARRLEGAHINRSLLALGNCINALSGGARYVNYRDSKLTRLLREALGGRCRTAMVAHVAPAASHRDTTRNTLAYALRAATITTKIEREVVKPQIHASQYHNVISDLRDQISRLKMKMKENRPRSANSAKGNNENTKVQNQISNERPPAERDEENNQSVAHLKALRHAIVSTFKEQMRLRRRLVELDSHLLGLALDAERQHAVISHWEARFNRLYKPHATPGSRLSTQQSYSRRGVDALEMSGAVERGEAEVAAEQAWAELAAVEREQERVRDLRDETERQLQEVRVRGARLEEDLPSRIGSESERELLSLVCRVHELEADKLALQGDRAARRHELRRRDLAVRRREAQRALADEIVAVQKRIIDASGLRAPAELTELYALYQQEIQAAAYADSTEIADAYKLPPISASGSDHMTWSSESSGGSGSGRGSSSGERVWGAGDGRAGGAGGAGGPGGEWSWRLPQLQPTPAPRPRTRYSFSSGHTMKRFSSEDSLVTAAGSQHGH